ncbi:hypothetical protein J6E39_03810 [bacterium]|nr:hypothetical protein [bacterium]
MEISSNQPFLSLVQKQQQEKKILAQPQTTAEVETTTPVNTNVDYSLRELAEIAGTGINSNSISVPLSEPHLVVMRTTSDDFVDKSQERQIKHLIYLYFHTEAPRLENPDDSKDKKSYISEFTDTTTMFNFVNSIDNTINYNTGISRTKLLNLIKRENWEDANKDFFGSLNRCFDKIDKDQDGTLAFNEILEFMGEEVGDFNTYKAKVEAYAAEIQNEYEKLGDQAKLEYAIDKTREYLEAAGLTNQLKALERLLSEEDTYNKKVGIGQITIDKLDPGTLGQYAPLGCSFDAPYDCYTDPDTGIKYGYSIYITDKDGSKDSDGVAHDLGITLDSSLLSAKWYELVDVLVHELTHATAYLYFTPDENGQLGNIEESLKLMYEQKVLTNEQYNYYKTNSNNLTIEEQVKLCFLAETIWGEYSAYQADADYMDSIAGDVYDAGSNIGIIGNGKDEKSIIMNQVDTFYDNDYDKDGKPIPHDKKEAYTEEWQWWTWTA